MHRSGRDERSEYLQIYRYITLWLGLVLHILFVIISLIRIPWQWRRFDAIARLYTPSHECEDSLTGRLCQFLHVEELWSRCACVCGGKRERG